jgi:hypothetical protein
MKAAFVLTALVCGVASGSSPAPAAETSAGAGPRVTMFGDSVADSLNYVREAREFLADGIDLRLELSPCRKLVPIGCAYQGSRPPSVLDIVKSSSLAQLGSTVVVSVGYNDPANNYETDMAQVAIALVEKGVGQIVWVTVRERNEDYRSINATIRAQAPRWPQLQIADWEAASRGKDWFNQDGLHLNASGALGLAMLLRPYVLAACGSACHTPTAEAPRNTRLPTVRGTPVVGRTLTCRPGLWRGAAPIRFAYRWLRGDRVLRGSVARSRRVERADRGRDVACRVWAANAAGAAAATSRAVQIRTG